MLLFLPGDVLLFRPGNEMLLFRPGAEPTAGADGPVLPRLGCILLLALAVLSHHLPQFAPPRYGSCNTTTVADWRLKRLVVKGFPLGKSFESLRIFDQCDHLRPSSWTSFFAPSGAVRATSPRRLIGGLHSAPPSRPGTVRATPPRRLIGGLHSVPPSRPGTVRATPPLWLTGD